MFSQLDPAYGHFRSHARFSYFPGAFNSMRVPLTPSKWQHRKIDSFSLTASASPILYIKKGIVKWNGQLIIVLLGILFFEKFKIKEIECETSDFG